MELLFAEIVYVTRKSIAKKAYIEDLTLVVVSFKTTTSVRFCLSYDPLKVYFIAFRMDNILMRKRIVNTVVVNEKCYYTCGQTIFITRRYPLNNSDVI